MRRAYWWDERGAEEVSFEAVFHPTIEFRPPAVPYTGIYVPVVDAQLSRIHGVGFLVFVVKSRTRPVKNIW